MNEVTLIEQCISGNAKAQYTLFETYSRKMMGVCLRYTKNQDEANDILQEGFIKVFSKLKDFTFSGSFEGWIRRIIVNTALDHIRKNAKFVDDIQLDVVDYQVGSDETILESLMAEDLMQLIQTMPTGYKVVFNMYAIEGYSHQEIATALGVSESTSKTQYLRAKNYLKTKIELLNNGR